MHARPRHGKRSQSGHPPPALGRTDEARLRFRHLKARLTMLGVDTSPAIKLLYDHMNQHF